MNLLDDVAEMAARDPGGMRERLERFPEQLREAEEIGRAAEPGVGGDGVSAVIVVGMGGSAIGGELAAAVLRDELRVPMAVVRDYAVPEFVGPDTLAFVSSYSGNTEETLSSYDDAHSRGARVVCSTTGGKLGRRARARGHAVIDLPSGYPPRAALGFGLVPLLLTLHRLGLASDPSDGIADAVTAAEAAAERCGLEVPEAGNPAKQLARWLHGRVPVIYGAAPVAAAVAHRWCGQFSENAKLVAHSNELPEMNHNEIVGWSDERPMGGGARVVFLRDAEEHPRVGRRMDITARAVEASGAEVREVGAVGRSRLGRLVDLVLTGDFVSFYLAMLKNVDPTPVTPIDRLKRALADS